jgi:mRNA interferase MazF
MSYAKKDVVLVDLGASPKPGKPSKEVMGHEQGDKRPCVVIRPYIQIGLLTVIPCTTKKPKYNSFTVVHLPKGTGGLKEDSYALCHQIRTVSVDRVIPPTWGKLLGDEYGKINTVLIDILL